MGRVSNLALILRTGLRKEEEKEISKTVGKMGFL